jgi:hypothetical protein
LTALVEALMLLRGILEKHLRYRILITEDEDGEFTAECPSLPGCISQGKTRELALLAHSAWAEYPGRCVQR